MIENAPQQPSWQDISLEEINALLAEEKIAEALFLTRLRLRGISTMPAELDDARKSATYIDDLEWSETSRMFKEEIAQLEKIIAYLETKI